MEQIFNFILELSENGVFEIWSPKDSSEVYIPYMMNDALECFIVLEDSVKVGEPREDLKAETKASVHKAEDGRYVLVARQGEENTYTVFFSCGHLEKRYYRFDGICHFWEKGQEHWGQLVYTIGTMFDKYAFLGKESCNRQERYLLALIEYAPFRAYAPAKQLFEELYNTTRRGILRMIAVSVRAGDYFFAIANLPYLVWPNSVMQNFLSKRMRHVRRYGLYTFLYQKTMEAAEKYPERFYGDNTLLSCRKKLHQHLLQQGYEGNYPDYHNGNRFVRVVEERPFTIMDWEDFVLRQRLMVSECKGRRKGFNLGFFQGANASQHVEEVHL